MQDTAASSNCWLGVQWIVLLALDTSRFRVQAKGLGFRVYGIVLDILNSTLRLKPNTATQLIDSVDIEHLLRSERESTEPLNPKTPASSKYKP